ncbi:MAG: hypothetical protein K5656_11150, partial [Lachnospiraceae bacterium]|nr:hypothetical protein [Lachnospiraceae bacterium]
INTLSSKDIQYYDKEGMISQLKRIRIQAEENKLSSKAILFIYIPRNYFIQDSATDSISILDMPGIESRNHKEYVHVQNLMTKYIPIASVCIITCRSNEIQSLESLTLPNALEWKRMEHRFILVITHAYIDGTIKQYFETEPSKRDSSFYDYVIGAYVHDIRKILGSKNHTEVYPIDVGDTLTRLCNEEIKRVCDRKEIIETKERVLANLRKSIIGRKGERLKSALMDLDVLIKNYGEVEITRIDDEISDLNSKINDSKNSIKRAVNEIKKLSDEDGEQDELLIESNELKDLKNKFLNLDPCILDFMNQTKQYIYNQKLYKSKLKCDYLRDRDKNVLEFMRVHISELVDKYIEKLNNLIGENDIPHVEVANIRNKTDSYILEEEQNIYPEKLFSKKVSIETIEGICSSLQEKINNYIDFYYVKRSIIPKVEKLIITNNNKIIKKDSLIKTNEDVKNEHNQKVQSYQNDIKKWKRNKSDTIEKMNQDQKTLEMYLNYAKKAYIEQRNSVVQQINDSKNKDDKILLVLFLGVLDKDYQKVIGGIHEKQY